MGLPALALHSVPEPYRIVQQPKETPKRLVESPLSDLEVFEANSIYPPFRGWQIFKKPILIARQDEKNKDIYLDEGVYLIEFNSGYKDLSVFNDNNEFEKLQYELHFVSSPDIKHIIISFYNCYNSTRTTDIANFFEDYRTSFVRQGKRLSLAHLEGHLYGETSLKRLGLFVHENVPDAFRNNISEEQGLISATKQNNENHYQEQPLIPPEMRGLRLFQDGQDIPEYFLG